MNKAELEGGGTETSTIIRSRKLERSLRQDPNNVILLPSDGE
jgi:hypothetical protein